MVLFAVLLLMLIVLVAITAVGIGVGGALAIVLFGDVIVCIAIIVRIIKCLIKKKKK